MVYRDAYPPGSVEPAIRNDWIKYKSTTWYLVQLWGHSYEIKRAMGAEWRESEGYRLCRGRW